MVERYGYDEFGRNLYQDQNSLQPFGYTGYQYDPIAGTYYAQAREYQALEGRFAGTDQIKGFMPYPQTLNEYAYCMNSPMCYVDVDGNIWHILVGAAIGVVEKLLFHKYKDGAKNLCQISLMRFIWQTVSDRK